MVIEQVVCAFQIDLVYVALRNLEWLKVRRFDIACIVLFSPNLLGCSDLTIAFLNCGREVRTAIVGHKAERDPPPIFIAVDKVVGIKILLHRFVYRIVLKVYHNLSLVDSIHDQDADEHETEEDTAVSLQFTFAIF